VSAGNLTKFVKQNDDFGFEMRVGAAIANGGGSDIWHGATYTDPKTELARQFDWFDPGR
jgi:hypothetical protein